MLTPEQCESYQRNGYLLVPNLFSKAQLAPALEVAEQNAYGKSHEEFNAEIDAHPEIAETLIRPKGRRSFGGPRAQFHDIPTGIDAIDRTLEHEPFLDALSQLLDTPDMHYHHGFVYARSGRLDRGTPKEPWQGFHIDWAKPLLPPHPEWQRYGHIQAWVYLTDNDADCAPVRVLPGAHSKMNKLIRDPLGTEHASYRFDDIRELPFKFEPVTATGKTGTVLFYSSHTPHSAQAFTNPRKQRAVLFYAVGRRDTSTWTLTEKRDIQERRRLRPFLTKTTARVRSLFGWPNPGDDFYTPETLHLIKNAYPEMDLSPYKEHRA